MRTEKTLTVDSKSSESNAGLDPRVEFVVRTSLHEDYVDTDFVHSILGRILAKVDDESPPELFSVQYSGVCREPLIPRTSGNSE